MEAVPHQILVAGATPLHHEDQQRPGHDEEQAGIDDQAAQAAQTRHRRQTPPAQDAQAFPQHAKTDAPQDDADADDRADQAVFPEGDHIVRRQSETGVAEGRDRMEQGTEGRKEHRIMQEQHQRGQQLHAQDDAHDLQEELPHIEIPAQQGLAHGLAAGEGHLLAPQEKDQAGIGHDAQAAHLDEDQHHALSHRAQHLADVHRGQAGHTDCGSRQERSIHHGEGSSFAMTDGQAQGQCPQQDHGRKGDGRPCQGSEITFTLHALLWAQDASSVRQTASA